MDDALYVGTGLVDGGVQHEAGLADGEVCGALLHHLALHVDLDQAGGGHLAVEHAEGVEKEVLRVLAHPRRHVVIDVLGPAVQLYQPVDRGQLAAQQLLSLRVDHRVNPADVVDGNDTAVGGLGTCKENIALL